MVRTRSIPIKGPLVKMMAERFPDFAFGGTQPGLYGFTRERGRHIYEHIHFCRDFFQGTGSLSVGWVYCCFNPNWQIYPAFCLGERVHMEKLLMGKRSPVGVSADIASRYYQKPEGLSVERAMGELERDLRNHVLPWLEGMERKLQGQGSRIALIDCAEPYIGSLTEEDREALSRWMHDNRKPCPARYQEALEAVLSLPEFKPPRMAKKAEKFLWSWTANRLLIPDYH